MSAFHPKLPVRFRPKADTHFPVASSEGRAQAFRSQTGGNDMRAHIVFVALAGLFATSAPAQSPTNNSPITIESYYRLSWGSYREWLRLFDKNEAPVLAELQRQGLIRSFVVERPFTHMAGDERWDFRVRATYRDPEAAVGIGGSFDKAWEGAVKKLFPNASERQAEERQRAAIVEEHWDVIVMPHGN